MSSFPKSEGEKVPVSSPYVMCTPHLPSLVITGWGSIQSFAPFIHAFFSNVQQLSKDLEKPRFFNLTAAMWRLPRLSSV